MTIKKGIEYENPNSVRYVQPFIDRFNIDMSQFEIPEEGWKHFNDFFYRKLKPNARPIYELVSFYPSFLVFFLFFFRIILYIVLVLLIVDYLFFLPFLKLLMFGLKVKILIYEVY